jgi:hypothetical protein
MRRADFLVCQLSSVLENVIMEGETREETRTSSFVQSVHHCFSGVCLQPCSQEQTFFFGKELCCFGPVADPESGSDANKDGQDSFDDEDPVFQSQHLPSMICRSESYHLQPEYPPIPSIFARA